MKAFFALFLFLNLMGSVTKAEKLSLLPSVVCPEKDSSKLVTCCLEEEKACENAFSQIPKSMLERAKLVHDLYFQGKFSYGHVPNCHWSTYSFLTGHTQDMGPFSDGKILDLIDAGILKEIPPENAQKGDVVLFFFKGEMRVESSRPGGGWQYVPYLSFEHSAVLVDRGVLFQKENVGTSVFSLAPVEKTRAAYESSFPARRKRLRGNFIVKYYHPQPIALSCQGVTEREDEYSLYRLQCQNGVPQTKERIFKSTGEVGSRLIYVNGIPSRRNVYDAKGNWTQAFKYDVLKNTHVIRTQYKVENQKLKEVKSKVELVNFDPESEEVQLKSFVLREWFYSEENPKELQFIATYDKKHSQRIIRKDYEKSFITFQYDSHFSGEKPVGFKEFSKATGKQINSYKIGEPFDPQAALEELNLSQSEIQRRLKHQKNPNRFLIAIIDSGFDYNHPELAWKWWNNPDDPVNGVDDDGNGWVDDFFGWDHERDSFLPAETTSSLSSKELPRPDSHGTHVAHIATRDLEGIALVGFAGDYTKKDYIKKISDFFFRHPVKVVNMSFGFPQDFKNNLGVRDANRAYAQMISEHPEILFVIAAGNTPVDIDDPKNHQYPANLNGPNVIKVGSLDTPQINRSQLSTYKMSPWSSFGLTSVDILAPGKDISAARLGGGLVVHSGTSMATPYMTHEIARLWKKHPRLKAAQVKQIFLQSAYQMIPRPQIVSGGFVDFERASQLAGFLDRAVTK